VTRVSRIVSEYASLDRNRQQAPKWSFQVLTTALLRSQRAFTCAVTAFIRSWPTLGTLYNSYFAFNRTLQFLSRGLVSFALIGSNCLLYAIKLNDYSSLSRSALKRLHRIASDNGSPSLRLQCRNSQLGVFGKSGGIRN
jgi:hypothetical protein